jgi:hypothetical protein
VACLNALSRVPAFGDFFLPQQAGFARLEMEITDGEAVGDTDRKMPNRLERTVKYAIR